jgi:hypothetical protein
MAKWFAGIIDYNVDTNRYEDIKHDGKVITKTINLKNPYIIDSDDEDFDSVQIYFDEIKEYSNVLNYRNQLISKGYDGIILKNCNTNYYEDGTYIVYIVFDEIRESKINKLSLLAPNGKPSNLPKNLYDYVRTSEFKSWFGDWENNPKNASKIIDENGEPLLVYHGTKFKFDEFDENKQKNGWLGKGFYFTDDKKETKEHGGKLIKAFLNIRKPFKFTSNNRNDIYYELNLKPDLFTDVSLIIKEKGYDGTTYTDWDKGNFITCFTPNQIKIITDKTLISESSQYSNKLIQYHYTTSDVNFDKFKIAKKDLGIHVGTLNQAIDRKRILKKNDGRILKLDIDIKNPLLIEDLGLWFAPDILKELSYLPDDELEYLIEVTFYGTMEQHLENLRKGLLHLGYDSLKYIKLESCK